MQYAVFGDSYVTRLEKFTHGILNLNGSHQFFGVPGMSTHRKCQTMFDKLLQHKPRYVFMILGGNDIKSNSTPSVVYKDILDIVEKMYTAGVERVFVAGIVERGRFPSWTGLTCKSFNKIRCAVNRKLKHKLGEDFVDMAKTLKYPRHYSQDLVHPGDTEGGMRLLQFCVVNAFRRTL